MKSIRKKQNEIRQVRVRATGEVYYTNKIWETREIDGIPFIQVMKNVGSPVRLMRKDTVEYLK